MTNTILAHSHFDQDHLEAVANQMSELGSPTIRVIDGGDHYIAIEGSHRLRAAEQTDTPVMFDVLDEDGEIDLETLDLDDNGWFCGETVVSVAEFIEWFTKNPFPADAATVEVEAA